MSPLRILCVRLKSNGGNFRISRYTMKLQSTNLIKESIRMGYNDFGDFYYAHGQLGDAFKNYVRTRDYCTTAKHIVNMCLNAILVSIEMGQFSHVTSYVSKAEQSPEALDPVIVAKMRCAAGLAHLEAKKYKLAARKFLEVGPELGNNYSEVIAPQDVATYGELCALATFDRAELKSKVIDNINFRNFLELVPELRELINDFYSRGGKYTEDDAKAVMLQILSVVSCCHLQGVVHRDLKPENFLFTSKDEDSQLKAIDFGLSDFIKPGSHDMNKAH